MVLGLGLVVDVMKGSTTDDDDDDDDDLLWLRD